MHKKNFFFNYSFFFILQTQDKNLFPCNLNIFKKKTQTTNKQKLINSIYLSIVYSLFFFYFLLYILFILLTAFRFENWLWVGTSVKYFFLFLVFSFVFCVHAVLTFLYG